MTRSMRTRTAANHLYNSTEGADSLVRVEVVIEVRAVDEIMTGGASVCIVGRLVDVEV